MRTPATARQVAASAVSSGPDPIGEACASAVDSLGGDTGLLLAFASGDFDHDRAGRELADAARGSPAAGLTGSGVFARGGPLEEGCAAIAFGTQVRACVGVAVDAGRDLRGAGHAATKEALDGLSRRADIVLMFIDSTTGDIAETVFGAYEAAGPKVPLAGGAAGGAWKRHFHGGRATMDSVVAVAIEADGPIAAAETQCAKRRGAPAIVTRSDGQVIAEVDGRPALEVYLEQTGFAGIPLDDEEFESISITHPIAQPEMHGERRLRHVLGRNPDGSLILGTHIHAGAAIEFTELGFDELLASGAASVSQAAAALGTAPGAALVFDCAGRRRALGDGLDREVESIAGALGTGAPPLAGLYTNGEVARLKGAKGDRNHAVVTVAFG